MKKTILSLCLLGSTLILLGQEIGLASYYSDKYNGGKTASGEIYNRNELVAAHKSLPFGTRLRVSRLDNGKSVVVRIIDRMPDIKGRVIDLSGRAAEQLNMMDEGTTQVELQPLGAATTERRPTPTTQPVAPKPVPRPAPVERPKDEDPVTITVPDDPGTEITITVEESDPTPPPATPKPAPVKPAPATPTPTPKPPTTTNTLQAKTVKEYRPYDLYKIQILRPEKTGYGVQVANLSSYENAMKQIADLQAKYFDNVLLSITPGKTEGSKTYRIILGPFPDLEKATAYKRSLKKNKKMNGFVVELSQF